MSREALYTLECRSGAFQPFDAVVQDEQGKPLWTVRERYAASGFLMKFLRLRTIFQLLLELEGRGQSYFIRRPKGFWLARYAIEQPEHFVLWNIHCGLSGWRIEDKYQHAIGEVNLPVRWFSDPIRAIIKTNNGNIVAQIEFTARYFTTKWNARISLQDAHEEWEVLAIAVATIWLVHRQER